MERVRMSPEQAMLRTARRITARAPFWVVRVVGPQEKDADGCFYSGRTATVLSCIQQHARDFGLAAMSFYDHANATDCYKALQKLES